VLGGTACEESVATDAEYPSDTASFEGEDPSRGTGSTCPCATPSKIGFPSSGNGDCLHVVDVGFVLCINEATSSSVQAMNA